jgi:hypothetical protein
MECGNGPEFVGGCFLDTQDGCHQITCCDNYPVGGGDGGDRHGVMFEAKDIDEYSLPVPSMMVQVQQ